jgi:hypothetical protein
MDLALFWHLFEIDHGAQHVVQRHWTRQRWREGQSLVEAGRNVAVTAVVNID